jgi:hypothetical protein
MEHNNEMPLEMGGITSDALTKWNGRRHHAMGSEWDE